MLKPMIEIDGSHKSGSGTIVRDAVSLSALTGQPLYIKNIRMKREKPGLRSQHLKGIEACCQICQGELQNVHIGSKEINFIPGKTLYGGEYYFDIGTAGSTALLASILLPVSIFSKKVLIVKIRGGLFQDFAPSAYYLQYVLFPVLRRMGIHVELKILQAGYYPKGNGLLQVHTEPQREKIQPLSLLDQGRICRISGLALSSLLEEKKVSDRMAAACRSSLKARGYRSDIKVIYDTRRHSAFSKVAIQAGACLMIWAETSNGCLIGSDMAGAPRRSAESIGEQVAKNLITDLETGTTVDRYLADQLIPFCALADGTSEFLIPRVTRHVESRLWLVEKILGARTQIRENWIIIQGIGYGR
jgi:RNA 3'-terminal phosphate cyclase (ATP)